MAALGALNSATPSLQPGLIRGRLDAARREADQAQAKVQHLREQVDVAQSELDQRNSRVRTLMGQATQAGQTDPTYRSRLSSGQPLSAPKTPELLSGIFNRQGQTTGRIVNLRA